MLLSGSNAYTGATMINAGKVITGNTSALGAGTAVTVAGGATLQIGDGNVNTVTLASGATLAVNGTLRFNAQTSAIILQGAGGYTLAAGSILDLNNVFNATGTYSPVLPEERERRPTARFPSSISTPPTSARPSRKAC